VTEDAITPEEVEALTTTEPTLEPTSSGVRPRDFRQPRRLSAEQLEELRVRVDLDLAQVASVLKPWLRTEQTLTLQTVSEVSFQGLPDSIQGTVCAMQFQADGSVGWVVWETDAALAATARAMGVESSSEDDEDGNPDEGEDSATKQLSSVEISIACKVLGEMLNALGVTLGFQADGFKLLQSQEELEHSILELRGTDTQRLRIDLELDGPGNPNTLKFYLPGVVPESTDTARQAQANPTAVPDHLSKISIEVKAAFDGIELSLDDLLALEVGDVIPLSTHVDDPINLTIEDLGCAKVRLGKKDGQLAVQLESLEIDSTSKQ